MEYLYLYGYIQNTPLDTEVQAEHQLRVDRSIWPVEKNIIEPCKTWKDEGTRGEKQECY